MPDGPAGVTRSGSPAGAGRGALRPADPYNPVVRLLPALLAVLAACAAPRSATSNAAPLDGTPLDVTAVDGAGDPVRLAGPGPIRVIDFWATWCEPCKEQLPYLDGLAARLHDRGVTVVAVSFDEERAAVDAFLAAHPVSFPVLWDRAGAGAAERLRIDRLPTTLLVDRRGVVRRVHVGFDAASAEVLERELSALAAEPAASR
jgi:thiol-disulfide isomerase/thioredoxin